MELGELEVGELRAGVAGEQQAGAEGARRVGRARPQGGGAAGGEDHRPGGEDAAVVGEQADAAPVVVGEQPRGARALEHGDALVGGDVGRQLAQDAPARRAAAGVHDPPHAVPALEAEREVAVAVGVEAHAERLEVAHARRRLLDQDLGRRAAHEVAAGEQRVLEVARRRVLDGQRRGGAALRPVGGGLGQRPGGDERDARALAGPR